jgi:hypothetical protein
MSGSAMAAAEARWLEEPDRPVTCDRHGITLAPDEDCPGCEDDAYDYACSDTPEDGEYE